MLRKKKKLILKANIKNIIILKYLYINIILKSIFNNRNIENKKRLITSFFYKKTNIKYITSNICLISGRFKNTNKRLLFSRHNVNNYCKKGLINNFKIKSW